MCCLSLPFSHTHTVYQRHWKPGFRGDDSINPSHVCPSLSPSQTGNYGNQRPCFPRRCWVAMVTVTQMKWRAPVIVWFALLMAEAHTVPLCQGRLGEAWRGRDIYSSEAGCFFSAFLHTFFASGGFQLIEEDNINKLEASGTGSKTVYMCLLFQNSTWTQRWLAISFN